MRDKGKEGFRTGRIHERMKQDWRDSGLDGLLVVLCHLCVFFVVLCVIFFFFPYKIMVSHMCVT